MKQIPGCFGAALLCAFAFAGCEKPQKPTPPDEPAIAVAETTPAPAPALPPPAPAPAPPTPEAPPPPPAPEPAPLPANPVDRAQALGFARFIPAGAEALVSFHQGKKLIADVQASPLWAAFDSGLAGPFLGNDAEDAIENADDFSDLQGILEEENFEAPATIAPLDFFGTEVTLALGPESAGRVAGFLNFNRRSTYFQLRALAAAMSSQENGEPEIDPFSTGMAGLLFGMVSEMYGDLLTDREALAGLAAFQMPAIYFAVRAEGDNLAAVHDKLSEPVQFFSMFGEAVAPAEVEHAGNTFRGFRLIGKDIAKLLEEDREGMEESLGREPTRVLMDFISTREIVALSGTIEDYAVAFFGSSIDEFKLAATPAESIAASPELAFADPVLAHPLHGVIYGSKRLTEALSASMATLADYADGLGDGFATHDRDGRNRDLVAMLQLVADRERALRSLATHETTGITVVNDNGLRIDMQGGHSGMLDFTTPSRFAALADAPDTAVFFNMTTDPRHRDRSLAYQEALFQAAHTLMLRVMDRPARNLDFENDDEALEMAAYDPFAGIREMASLVESDFRPHLINLWQAVAHDMRKGLGNETAIIVDLKGTMPEIPDVPKAIYENTKTPRVTLLSQVVDRASLANSWQTIQESATHLVERVAEMNDKEFPIPKPMHSKSDGFTTWFLPLPWFNDEFLPSVTLDDQWFAMGTSRNQAADLLGRLDALETRSGTGLRLHVKFRVIAASQREEIANVTARREAILETGEIEAEAFDQLLKDWEALATALEQLEDFEVRCWQEDGLTRTLVHLRNRP